MFDKNIKHRLLLCMVVSVVLLLTSCRGDEIIFPAEYEVLPMESRELSSFAANEPIGMYLLNEGNMGSNKATIDYLDFSKGIYIRNIYGERNPNVIKELGDVGNDIQVYGNRLYAVINCSHKVEVMDLYTCRRIGQIDIPNCRYIRFHQDKAYISSYVGPVSIDPNAQLGAIFEVDTATLRITREVTVGYQPEEFEIIDGYLYVANSGGYRAPDYDSTLSVVDLTDFRQIKKIPVCVNPHRVRKDQYNRLWITSRGDHKDVQPQLVCLQPISNSSSERPIGGTPSNSGVPEQSVDCWGANSPQSGRPITAKFTPALFLSYRPTQLVDLRINAFYKQSYRYPTFNDLYYTDMGNAYLKPELAKQHSVGLSFMQPFRIAQKRGSEFRLNADYYYNRISDKIIAYPKGQQFRWTMLNLGLVKINGLDINAQLHLVLPMDFYLTAKAQYTYQTAIDVTDPNDSYYGDQIPYIPWHSGSAVGMFGWQNDWMQYGLNYSFIYVGERYNQQENIIFNYTQPWYTHDLSIFGEWAFGAKSKESKLKYPITLRVALDVNNLLSQDYDVILNYPMPKRNFKCTVSITY